MWLKMEEEKLYERKQAEKRHKSALKNQIELQIDGLVYTADETKDVYRQELLLCEDYSDLNELVSVINCGEQQLREIQQKLFKKLESYIWKIHALSYLTMKQKTYWIEELISSDLPEEMAAIYSKALKAEFRASQDKRRGWTVVKK